MSSQWWCLRWLRLVLCFPPLEPDFSHWLALPGFSSPSLRSADHHHRAHDCDKYFFFNDKRLKKKGTDARAQMLPYPLHLCDQNDHNHHIFSPLISLVITKIMIAMTNIMIAITKIMIAITRMGSFRSSTRWVFYHRATNPQELSCSL